MVALEGSPKNHKLMYVANHTNICLMKMRTDTFELQSKTPLAAAFKEFVKKNIVEGGGSKDHSNNTYGLPVLPEELQN